MLGILAVIIYRFNLNGASRFVLLTSLIISFSIEISYLFYKTKYKLNYKNINLYYSSKVFSFEVLLFGIITLYLLYKLNGNLHFNSQHIILFINLYLCWFAGSFLGHHFHPRHKTKDYWAFIWQYIKAYIIILSLSSFSGFINHLDISDILEILYGIVGYSIISFTAISTYYYIKNYRILALKIVGFPVKGELGDILLNEKIQDIKAHYRSSFKVYGSELTNSEIKNFSLQKYPEVYEFMNTCIDLSSFDYSYSIIVNSNVISCIDYLPDNGLQFLLNLERINRIPDLNEYFAVVNNKLRMGGIFTSNFETAYLKHQNYLKMYPYYFAQLFYLIDFLWNRVFPKIIFLKSIYNGLTGGTHKALSLAEGLGRLYFNGFEVLHLKIINGTMFFVAKKINSPSNDEYPSTGLIFKMKRIGKNGEKINIYKLRTMHPYAEYIQDFVYKKFNLKDGGKFKNDFRITYWGSVLRKLWLDELPMIYNLLKGDIKLVGPRPLGQHYFDLYRNDLKLKRMKHKPGLVPPFYVDMPKSLNEIMDSEERYLDLYEKKPIITDIKYFYQILISILLNRARSS